MHPVLFHIGALVIPSYGVAGAVGVLLALMLALHTARQVRLDPNRIWNLCILMLFSALFGSRLLLLIANWTVLRDHPLWVFGLAMVHHPLLAAVGVLLAITIGGAYTFLYHLPFRATADVLAAPTALGLAFEQTGALLAGSGYGTGTHVPWSIVYTDPLAARWSDAPLGIPVHPVQLYVALCALLTTIGLLWWLPRRSQNGDIAGIFLMSAGVVMYITEFWRDPIGRGALFNGFLKGPQLAGIILVIAGAFLLIERPSQRVTTSDASIETGQPVTNEQTHA